MERKTIIICVLSGALLGCVFTAVILLLHILPSTQAAPPSSDAISGPAVGLSNDPINDLVSAPTTDPSAPPDTISSRRPVVRDGTVMTASGTLMRGMISGAYEMLLTGGMKITFDDMAQVRNNGMNCVRFNVPIIWPYEQNEDENRKYLEAADLFVDWAAELGLYVWLGPSLMTDDDGRVFYDHMLDYWRIIAPRYKDEPHVFYDVMNEMGEPEQGHPQRGQSPLLMAQAYDLIRGLAPNTLCILWSFSHTFDLDETLWCLTEMEQLVSTPISWANEAVGFHAYETANGYRDEDSWINYELMRFVIKWFKQHGYPIMNTEVPSLTVGYEGGLDLTSYPNPELLRILEAEGVSWTTMLHAAHFNEPSVWRGLIDRHGIGWQPDYGDWPAVGLINPYQAQSAVALPYETNSANRSMSEAESMVEMGNPFVNFIPSLFVNNTHYVTYRDVNFGSLEPISLTVRVRGFEDGAVIVVREGGSDGPVICEIPIRRVDGANVYYTAYLLRPISGVKDITFTFRGADEDMDYFALCYFIDWQFNLPPVDSAYLHTDIWNKPLPAARFHFRNNGGLWRAPSDDAGAATEMGRNVKVSGITDGSQLLYSMAVFATGGDGELSVRAKALAGGRIEIYANWGFRIWPDPSWTFSLGRWEINGTAGEWETYTLRIPAEILNQVNYGGSYTPHALDLMFRFTAAEGIPRSEELFEISEFYFTRS